MATIPLPELSIRPPEQTDILGQYGKAVALKSMLQQQQYQQQMQPLQLQQEQQAVQIQQQQIRDMQAGQSAFGEWDGKDYNNLASLIIKHGGSLNAANQVAMYGLNREKTLADIYKSQNEGLKAQTEATAKNHDQAAGALNSLLDLPDTQLQQGLLNVAQRGVNEGWLDKSYMTQAQQLAQQPAQQIRQAIPNVVKMFQAESEQIKNAKDIAETQTAQAGLPGVKAKAAQEVAEQQGYQTWAANQPSGADTSPAAYKAYGEGLAAKAKFPYEAGLVRVRQQVENEFWQNKDAIGKVETQVLKPYQDQMQEVQQLNDAITMAEQGNSAAARAVVPKLVGISQPLGSKRYNQKEAESLTKQGNVPERFQSLVQNLATGSPWTPKMSSDMRDLADAVGSTATNSANNAITNINALHGTKVGALPQYQAPARPGQARRVVDLTK